MSVEQNHLFSPEWVLGVSFRKKSIPVVGTLVYTRRVLPSRTAKYKDKNWRYTVRDRLHTYQDKDSLHLQFVTLQHAGCFSKTIRKYPQRFFFTRKKVSVTRIVIVAPSESPKTWRLTSPTVVVPGQRCLLERSQGHSWIFQSCTTMCSPKNYAWWITPATNIIRVLLFRLWLSLPPCALRSPWDVSWRDHGTRLVTTHLFCSEMKKFNGDYSVYGR